jgi:hypothetical protein
MRIDALDHLAVKLQHKAKHPMGGGMLRAEIDVEVADVVFGHREAAFGNRQSAIGSRIMTATLHS